ncbi:MAG: hypothetical protein HFK04_04525 [Oscillospiraceae bacterium]|nr:hypothetical protein [Oscillospiraceae bacterium]
MTIREAVSVLSNAKNIFIAWRGGIVEINPNDSLMMSAFGGYKVKEICNSWEKDSFEIHVDAVPVRETISGSPGRRRRHERKEHKAK